MDEFDETADDLCAAFEDLRAAGGEEPRHRRALKAVLNELYRVQEYRKGRNKEHEDSYFDRAKNCDAGQTTLGVVYARGVLTHHLIVKVQPTPQPLHPGANTFPGPDTFPGENFTWITGDELRRRHTPDRKDKSQPYYDSLVGGRLMLPTIRQAIDFLLTDPTIVTLRYV